MGTATPQNDTKSDIAKCEDCEKEYDLNGTEIIPLCDVKHLFERLDPGGIVPAGECPECRSLCYLKRRAIEIFMRWGEVDKAEERPVTQHEFDSLSEVSAFLEGVCEADGWLSGEVVVKCPKHDGFRPEGEDCNECSLEEEEEDCPNCDDQGHAARFPIQGGPSIPWDMIAPHETQCVRNHGQSLERLAERGGLSPSEALAILDDENWFTQSKWSNFITEPGARHDHPKIKAALVELERRRKEYEERFMDDQEEEE